TRLDLLRRAGAEEATLLIFCHDDRHFGPGTLAPILEAFPQAAVLVRTFDRSHLIAVHDLPLAGTVREVFESAVTMGRAALTRLGLDETQVNEIERQYRA